MGDQYPSKPRHHAVAPGPESSRSKAPAELSDDESDLVASRREAFLTLMPDAYPFFRDLHANGLIDGWRAVCWVRPLADSESE